MIQLHARLAARSDQLVALRCCEASRVESKSN